MKTQFCGDEIHPCLNVIKSNNNKPLVEIKEEKTGEKQYYRAYNCIENSISYDVSTDKKVVYKDGKFYIPVTVMDVRFEDESGEEVYITTPYNDETGGYELGDFYIPVNLYVLDENGENVSTLQAQEDGTINNIDQIFYHTKTGYELYYVNTKGEKVDFNDFKVLENTTIKQAWSPVGNIHSFDSMYNSETKVLTYCGTVYKNENGYYVPVTIQAPQGYNTSNTKVNGKTVTFTEEMAVVDVTVTEKGVEIPIVVEWENGIEVTFKLLVDANAPQTYSVTYYDAKDEVLEQFNNVMLNEQVQEALKRPSKEGYVFAGWTTNKETNEKIDFTNQYVTGDMKFYPIFKTLEEAIETSSHDNPVVLYDDVVITETIILDVNQDMVLDLNGHRITSEGHNAFRLKGTNAALTVRNGYINVTGGAAIAVGASKEDTTNVERRYLKIEPTVYITSSSIVVDNKTISAFGITHFGKSEIDFYGNITINGSGYGISGNGLANNEGTILNIYSGNITAMDGAAIYQPQLGTSNISGGTFMANTVIGIKAGTLNITGGTFTANGAAQPPKPNGNGFDLTGDVIIAEENDAYADHVQINITGGSFYSSNGEIIREYNPSLGTENERYVTVSGLYSNRVSTENPIIFIYKAN